jgi:hypothetical protein
MKRRLARVMVLATLVACGKGAGSNGSTIKIGDRVDINGDGVLDGTAIDQDGDGVADSVDLDGDGLPDALLPGVSPPVRRDAAAGDGDLVPGDGDGDHISRDAGGDGDTGQPLDAGGGKVDAGPPLVIEIPLAKVPCGSSICEIKNDNVCCESWTAAGGFGTKSMCITDDACVLSGINDQGLYAEAVTEPRAVTSRCDGAEDCGANEVCCYVRRGMPLSDFLGPPWTGPGAGRQCLSYDDCTADGAASGVPTGIASCNDDKDCKQFKGTTCQSEQDNTATTGKNVKARPTFKVCR